MASRPTLTASAGPGLGEKLLALNWPLVALVGLLGLVGYALLYSAGGGSHTPWALRHGIRLAVMLLVSIALALVDVRRLFRVAYPLYGIVLVLLVSVEMVGSINKGAQRWIDLGSSSSSPPSS